MLIKLLSGDIVDGRYVMIDRVNDGGMGSIFSASEIGLERKVALK